MTSTGVNRRALQSLPIIDVSCFVESGDLAQRNAVAQQIRDACIDIGFFYIVGHGISERESAEALQWAHRFFSLPLATKLSVSTANSSAGRGFVQIGGLENTTDAPDLKERFMMTREHLAGEPPEGNFHAGESQWPDPNLLTGFEPFMKSHIVKRTELARKLARAFALSLQLEETYFDEMYRFPGANLLLNYYPSVDTATLQENQWSFSPHTDYGAFTILLQDAVGGLQARNAGGVWIDVPPIANTFVVNVGDLFAMWTNDLYMSTLHRAMNVAGTARVSIPLFTYPNGTSVVRCLPTCQSADNPARYHEITAEEYSKTLHKDIIRSGLPGISPRTAERLSETY